MLNDEDIIRITVNQELVGEDIKNVFFYLIEVLTTGITLLEVLAEFKDAVWDFMRPLQVPDIQTLAFVGENLTNGIDVETLPIGEPGTDGTGGAVLPSYVAGGYRLNVADKTTRPGGKRISGIGEARVLDNNYNPDAAASVVAILALSFAFAIVGTPVGAGIGTPVVVGRNILGQIDLTRVSVVVSASESSTIRTQTSRRAPVL